MEAFFPCPLARPSSCVSARFLIIAINVCFRGRREEGMRKMESLKVGRKKAKKDRHTQ